MEEEQRSGQYEYPSEREQHLRAAKFGSGKKTSFSDSFPSEREDIQGLNLDSRADMLTVGWIFKPNTVSATCEDLLSSDIGGKLRLTVEMLTIFMFQFFESFGNLIVPLH